MSHVPDHIVTLVNNEVDPSLTGGMPKDEKVKTARQKTRELIRAVKEASEAKVQAVKAS
jgi:glutamate-1-semialdehyde aminotransferase